MNSKSQQLSVCAGAILILAATIHAQGQFNYTTLSVPGATNTSAQGISGNNIVGYCDDASGGHGFIYNGSSYTTLNVPGATSSYAQGNSGTNIVGGYDVGSASHGFLYNGSSYTTLNVPGALNTYPQGISGNTIVGFYEYPAYHFSGFVFDGTNYRRPFNVPGAVITYLYGISGNNIVGACTDASGAHGFVYDGNGYTTVKPPGATSSAALGISGNKIVGMYFDGQNRSFLATLAPPPLHLAGAQQWAGLTSLQLTWSNSLCQCVLESAGAVTGAWSTVSSPWTTNAGCVCTVVTTSSTAQFYRLRAN